MDRDRRGLRLTLLRDVHGGRAWRCGWRNLATGVRGGRDLGAGVDGDIKARMTRDDTTTACAWND